MRKSLWTILVVIVFTALGSTSARADTIFATGGNVTAINGITIAGTTYNVTFGTTIDTTFAGSNLNALAMSSAIRSDLNLLPAFFAGGACSIGVDGGAITWAAERAPIADPNSCKNQLTPPWVSSIAYDTSLYTFEITSFPLGTFLWANFASAPTITPEPGTLMLTLTGVGLLGLTLVLRKRKAHDLARTT